MGLFALPVAAMQILPAGFFPMQ